MKKILSSLFLAVTLLANAADTVYITSKGKKYHAVKTCRSLKTSTNIKSVKKSNVRNCSACQICYLKK